MLTVLWLDAVKDRHAQLSRGQGLAQLFSTTGARREWTVVVKLTCAVR